MLDDYAFASELSWPPVKKKHPRAWHVVCDIYTILHI